MPNETVSETIKALECCAAKTLLNSTCGNCPYGNRIFSGAITCTFKLSQDALNLINRQQAEIERLKNEVSTMEHKMSYMISPNAIGDRHEMGCW